MHVFQSMIDYMDVMEAMRWRLLAAPADGFFITCDNPVFFFDPEFKAAEPGKSVKWSHASLFMFPLSRSFTLCGEYRKGPDLVGTASVEDLGRFKRTMVARGLKQIYAPYRDNRLRDLVDKVHTERPPIVQNIPDKFFHDHFDKFGRSGQN
jgi:hypothetical protein